MTGLFLAVRKWGPFAFVLAIALALVGIAVQQFVPAPAPERAAASPAQPPPGLDAELPRQDPARTPDVPPPLPPSKSMESRPGASELDALWESLKRFPGVETVRADEALDDPGVWALALEVQMGALKDALAWNGVALEEALARCGSSQGINAQDQRFCEEIRPANDRCQTLMRTPERLEKFVDHAQSAPEAKQAVLASRARKLAQFVVLVRNLCRP